MALAAPQMGWQPFNLQVTDKVIFIGEITNCPKQPGSHSLRLGFDPQLGFPFFTFRVLYIELGIVAVTVLLEKCDWKVRAMFITAGTIEQIFCSDIARIFPDDGGMLTLSGRNRFFLAHGGNGSQCKQ